MRKKKRKPVYKPGMDEKTQKVIENAIRIRTRMRVRDLSGDVKLFRATISEGETEDEETEGDSG